MTRGSSGKCGTFNMASSVNPIYFLLFKCVITWTILRSALTLLENIAWACMTCFGGWQILAGWGWGLSVGRVCSRNHLSAWRLFVAKNNNLLTRNSGNSRDILTATGHARLLFKQSALNSKLSFNLGRCCAIWEKLIERLKELILHKLWWVAGS